MFYNEEREKNIALFKPLFKLDASTKEEYTDLPLRQLGLAVLLYILEHMYQNERTCTLEKISSFLRYLIFDQMGKELQEEEAYRLTQYVVAKQLMNDGKPHKHTYWDFNKKSQMQYTFHLIEIEEQGRKGLAHLRLSNECLDMLFKTKELYGELKLSVRALFFKQQMSKNVFDGALQELREMKADVQTEKEEIERLKKDIRRNVLDPAKKEKIEERLSSVNQKLENEKKVFLDMTSLVKDLLKDWDEGNLGEEKNHAFILVKKIQKQLVEMVSAHDELFGKKLELQKFTTEAIQSLITQSFSVRVNFREEVLKRVVEEGTPTENVWRMIAPLFTWQFNKSFHPGVVFEPQRVYKRRDTQEAETAVGVFDEEYEEYVRKKEEERDEKRVSRLESYFRFILTPLTHQKKISLSELVESISDQGLYQDLLSRGNFYPFILELHQFGEIELFKAEDSKTAVFSPLSKALMNVCEQDEGIYQLGMFSIGKGERNQPVFLRNGYVMSDFVIRRGNHEK